MNTEIFDLFSDKEKAIHQALWLNFKYRITKIKFGVTNGPKNDYAVMEEATREEMELTFIDIPRDYTKLTFDEIRHIKMDRNPLPHWEKIGGMIATIDGEILRYLLHAKIPFEKLIRFELASRGHDENHRWCGYPKAHKLWLKEKN